MSATAKLVVSVGLFGSITNSQVHFAGYSHRNVSAGLVPISTVNHIASLSKGFTTASIGIIVADGMLSLDRSVFSTLF